MQATSLIPSARSLASKLDLALDVGGELQETLDECSLPAFIASRAGSIIARNSTFLAVFSASMSAIESDVLQQNGEASVVGIMSHRMIVSGCAYLEYEHVDQLADGQSIALRTAKACVRRSGMHSGAVVGLTKVLRCFTTEAGKQGSPSPSLNQRWRKFQRLERFDRDCLVLLGKGKTASEIAELLDVSRRNIEIRRKRLFSYFGVENGVQLGYLLCRLQDGGYEHFGI